MDRSRLGIPHPPYTMLDVARGRNNSAIYLSRKLTSTPYTVNNQMVSQPPATEVIDIFIFFVQLAVTCGWSCWVVSTKNHCKYER